MEAANAKPNFSEEEEAEEELIVRELLDDESPFFLLPNNNNNKNNNNHNQSNISNFNTLISKVYSGPTLLDIENALSLATPSHFLQSRNNSVIERSVSKIENNKYTLKLKSSGNGMADDGYKWRKYGQKSIKNSPFPRSYYRCTNPRCSAKKQVERSREEEDTVIITYEGLHLHFTFPFNFELGQQQREDQSPPLKRPKKMVAQKGPGDEAQLEGPSSDGGDYSQLESAVLSQPQGGLLEDVVPIMIRNPSKHGHKHGHGNGNGNGHSNSSTSSSNPSPPTSPSSLSWSSNNSYSCFDVGIDTAFLLAE